MGVRSARGCRGGGCMTRWCPEQRPAAFGEPRSPRERQSHQRGGRRFAWCPGSSGCRASAAGGAASAFALALLCGLRRGPTPGLGGERPRNCPLERSLRPYPKAPISFWNVLLEASGWESLEEWLSPTCRVIINVGCFRDCYSQRRYLDLHAP